MSKDNKKAETKQCTILSVSVSDLVEERRQWLLDNVWCCEEEDLNPRELHNFKMGLQQDKLVIEWVHLLH